MLTIQLDGPLEERLKLAAASRGDEPTALARRVLESNLPPIAGQVKNADQMAAIETFIAGMTFWVSQNVPPGHFADDSRESIYHGRGE